MRDPFAWSIPFGRLFGIEIRVHVLFPLAALGLVLRYATQDDLPSGAWKDGLVLIALLFGSVLLHEFGHCFGARWVGGDAEKVLMWPLGGLANVNVPHNPRAHFITTLMGPMVNLLLCAGAVAALWLVYSAQPSWNPLYATVRDGKGFFHLREWSGETSPFAPYSAPVLLAQLFWVNYFLFLLNVLLIGYPLDGGRMFQAIAWRYKGYQRATLWAVYAGYATMLIVGLAGIILNEVLMLCLALFIYFSCHQQHRELMHGGDEGIFGYDFSQGYTSLERNFEHEEEPPRQKRPGWWTRRRQRREESRRQREEAERIADEERLDQLLEKIHREGEVALTEEERRFMVRVSDRKRKLGH